MKKRNSIILGCFFVFLIILALMVGVFFMLSGVRGITPVTVEQIASSDNFRDVRWGMTVEQVKEAESEKLVRLENDLYKAITEVNGQPCTLVYSFMYGILAKGMYLFHSPHDDEENFEQLKILLQAKYHGPTHQHSSGKNRHTQIHSNHTIVKIELHEKQQTVIQGTEPTRLTITYQPTNITKYVNKDMIKDL